MKGTRRIFCVGALLSFAIMCGQKVVRKSILEPHLSVAQIDVDNCFELILGTSDTSEMVVEATMDGEYGPNLVVSTAQEGNTFKVAAGFRPDFTAPNDKLGAHKLVSISLKVQLPNYMVAKVFGNSCNVWATGRYRTLDILLGNGGCQLKEVGGDVTVRTQSGDIDLSAKNGSVMARSKYGEVLGDKIPLGNDIFKLETVTGNIHLRKTK
ncbi:MAG: hypothetical protein V7724_09435 [Sediminicola sp.]|tara:strand:+ start:50372 stop:51001 length:630 start_codon:yes stop_codon:yes gene_type:complete